MRQFSVIHVLKIRRGEETVNRDGDPVFRLGDPEDLPVATWHVTGGEEPGTDGHVQRVDYDAVAHVPVEADVQPEDAIEVPTVGWCLVDGPAGVWEGGPWWKPGLVRVKLKRVSSETEV